MNKSFLLQLANSCKNIEIPFRCSFLSTSDVQELYEIVKSGSTKIRSFKMRIEIDQIASFLLEIGFTARDSGTIVSNRYVEMFRGCVAGTCNVHIFEGNMEIWIIHNHEEEMNTTLYILSHENRESLEKAKYGRKLKKMDVEVE
ncbi:hypothetical protein PMAYCL1PPCAC_27966 [Pristionchus mayeri]|uniref:Uncharacterized protein n=1 Tax=Pristionchus mayeri TaxID=1317129 RepID=A0AAN5D6J4_9BILA|nr:hypothetical protein PMAYCL1PPCAC_27966 [Pristionchus mayeri]